jgi:hypothetical protein
VTRKKKRKPTPCAVCGKQSFRSEAAAKRAIARAEGRRRIADVFGVETGRKECRTYACESGFWHLTSKP